MKLLMELGMACEHRNYYVGKPDGFPGQQPPASHEVNESVKMGGRLGL
jgi:hypothetical protein